MDVFEIKNVAKDSHDNITHVGERYRWDLTLADAVRSIEIGKYGFYVNCPQRAEVYVATTPYGRKFLKTTSDTTTRNNLDNLPPLW